MPEDHMLREAIEAIHNGQRNRAKDLLTRLLRGDKDNPEYWLWMSAVVDTDRERIFCLQNVLRLDPDNPLAKLEMVNLGAMKPDEKLRPRPIERRNWQAEMRPKPPPRGLKAFLANPVSRAITFGSLGLLVVALLLVGVLGSRQHIISLRPRPTKTPGPPPTYTSTPTYIGYVAPSTATPMPEKPGVNPLAKLLQATYTPTALYVNTPHPISEAFQAGQVALIQGNWSSALSDFRQAAQTEPNAADIQYYIGEALRMSGDERQALQAYNQAIKIDARFAPAYLGRARVALAQDPQADVLADLSKAIDNDPAFVEAYLERAGVYLAQKDYTSAEQDVEKARQIRADSPLSYLYAAQIAMQQKSYLVALDNARKAYQLDRTLLPAYLVLGQASLMTNDFATASDVLATYVKYQKSDARGWLALAQAISGLGNRDDVYSALILPAPDRDYRSALEALQQAEKYDKQIADIPLYRGCIYLIMGDGQNAVNDLLDARRLNADLGVVKPPDPLWFALNLGLGRALLQAGRYQDAYGQLFTTQGLATNDNQRASVYYFRATADEALKDNAAARADWKLLLALPEKSVPVEWWKTARSHLTILVSTPTFTPTKSPFPSRTSTVTRTPLATRTPTATKTPRLTPSPTP